MELRYLLLGQNDSAGKGSGIVVSDIDFGELLRSKRKELNMRQDELAERAGVKLTTYGRIERGEVQPKLEQIRRLFSVLGLSLDAIEKQIEQRLTASECLNKIEFYVSELRKVMGR